MAAKTHHTKICRILLRAFATRTKRRTHGANFQPTDWNRKTQLMVLQRVKKCSPFLTFFTSFSDKEASCSAQRRITVFGFQTSNDIRGARRKSQGDNTITPLTSVHSHFHIFALTLQPEQLLLWLQSVFAFSFSQTFVSTLRVRSRKITSDLYIFLCLSKSSDVEGTHCIAARRQESRH